MNTLKVVFYMNDATPDDQTSYTIYITEKDWSVLETVLEREKFIKILPKHPFVDGLSVLLNVNHIIDIRITKLKEE